MAHRVLVLLGHMRRGCPETPQTVSSGAAGHSAAAEHRDHTCWKPCATAGTTGWLGTDQRWIELRDVKSVHGMRMSWMEDIGPIWCAWLAIKQVLHIKQIPLVLVRHPSIEAGQDELYTMTAQRSFPVLWWEDERPRSAWIEQISLAERVGSGPKLIPEDAASRIEMFGVLNELLGNEDGFCTHKRQMAFTKIAEMAGQAGNASGQAFATDFVAKYQFVDKSRAPKRVMEVLNLLDDMLRKQEARGSKYLIGDHLTVLDVYAAASMAVMAAPAGSPMGTKMLPPDMFGRKGIRFLMTAFAISTAENPGISGAFTVRLREYCDFIMTNFFEQQESYMFQ